MQMREKVGKSWNIVFFQWFGAPEGRKVGSLKRRVRSQLARWEMKHCTPARSTFASQNVQNTWCSEHFWKFRCRKSACRCGTKHISKSKVQKTDGYGALLDVQMCFRGRRRGLCTLAKVSKTWGFCGISKNAALISWEGLHFGASDLQVCWDDFAWQARHVVWPGINFSWQAPYFTQVEWKNRKTHWYESVSSALNFPFLKDVSQNASFLMACTSENEKVSQNCFVSDVVKFKKWRRLAELFRFGRSYVQTLRKSRRISSFLILQIDR